MTRTLADYSAACARYWADDCDVGYSQPGRLELWNGIDWAGWLTTSPVQCDCSSMVMAAVNCGFYEANSGQPPSGGWVPTDAWTGNLRRYLTERGYSDISDSWTGNAPPGGFRRGDVILSEAASGGVGHVAMSLSDGEYPILAEAWIDGVGDIMGDYGPDGQGDSGGEVRTCAWGDHPYTRRAQWTHCLRPPAIGGGSSASAPAAEPATRSGAAGYRLSAIQVAVLRAADAVGCPWWAALACLWMETGEYGANIFGHDVGGAYYGGGEVTEAKFRDFYRLITDGYTSNGVGPLQITYPGYFTRDPGRAWWDPQRSAEVGCEIIRDLIRSEGDSYEDLRRVGSRYNSGNASDAYYSYGVTFSERCRSWYEYGRPPFPDGSGYVAGGISSGGGVYTDITAIQRAVHADVDNVCGPDTRARVDAVRQASAWGGGIGGSDYSVEWTQGVVGTEQDGIWGDASEAAHDRTVIAIQIAVGAEPDGIWGPDTDARVRSALDGAEQA